MGANDDRNGSAAAPGSGTGQRSEERVAEPRNVRSAEAAIMAIAAEQHGVVTRVQLLRACVPPDLVDRRLRQGWLQRLHRGVYLVGPAVAPRAATMAAVLACGPSALASHRTAAILWQIGYGAAEPPKVEVIDRTGSHRPPGLTIYRIRTVASDEATRVDGIPATTPTRTLLDIAAILPAPQLERAAADALAKRLTTPAQIRTLVQRHPARAGTCALRSLVEGDRLDRTRSEAEAKFLRLVRASQLPMPEVNVFVDGIEVDFLWRKQGVVVEIDGFSSHAGRTAFERDRRRDATLAGAGLRVLRVSWRQLVAEPLAVVARLARALAWLDTR
jgi:very-short-patch-repair endonuclease